MAKIMRWNPVREASELFNEFDRYFDTPLYRGRMGMPLRTNDVVGSWSLALDVAEKDDFFTVKASLPGINPEDLNVTLEDNVLTVQGEIKKLKAERDVMLARMQSAQARLKIQEQLDGLSVDAEVKALDNVREHIKTTVAAANLGKELSESSLDARLSALKTTAGDVQAKQQLAELKAKRAAAQAQVQKTM